MHTMCTKKIVFTGLGMSLALLVLAVLNACAIPAKTAHGEITPASTNNTRSFPVSTQTTPTLNVSGNAGNIDLRHGANDRITVRTIAHFSGSGEAPYADYQFDHANNTLSAREVDPAYTPWGNSSLDFIITVPAMTNIQVATSSGNEHINGISGQFALKTSSGNINVEKVQLREKSNLTTTSGNITFEGSLQRDKGDYNMHTNVGSINITLPSTSNVRVNATINGVGTITSEFDSIVVTGKSAQGTIGDAPYAELSVDEQMSLIAFHKE